MILFLLNCTKNFHHKSTNSIPNQTPDIAIAVVELLVELTDVDVLNETEEGAEVLLDALVSFVRFQMTRQSLVPGKWPRVLVFVAWRSGYSVAGTEYGALEWRCERRRWWCSQHVGYHWKHDRIETWDLHNCWWTRPYCLVIKTTTGALKLPYFLLSQLKYSKRSTHNLNETTRF